MSEHGQVRVVTGEQVQQGLAASDGARLVDVRERGEWEAYHIPGITLLPLSEFAERSRSELSPEETIICICEHGVRSARAAEYLLSLGFPNVATMDGGMASYPGAVESGAM